MQRLSEDNKDNVIQLICKLEDWEYSWADCCVCGSTGAEALPSFCETHGSYLRGASGSSGRFVKDAQPREQHAAEADQRAAAHREKGQRECLHGMTIRTKSRSLAASVRKLCCSAVDTQRISAKRISGAKKRIQLDSFLKQFDFILFHPVHMMLDSFSFC